LALNFWGKGPAKFWDLDYKKELTSDRVATFRGDRPTELGDLAQKKRNTSNTTVPGGLINEPI